MKTQYITILDFVLLPFVLALIYAIAYWNRNRKYPPGHPWRKYYFPGLTVKVFGAIFIGLIYQYYYGGGDTFNYFYHAKIINSAFDGSFVKWLSLVFHLPAQNSLEYYQYIFQLYWYDDPASYTVCAITAFLSIMVFGTYLPTAVIFAYLSFTGFWALFRTFATIYPKFIRPVAFATLFIPSTFVWGSGIFKDTICMFGLGWLVYGTFRILILKDYSLKNLLIAALSLLLIFTIKIYILLAFIPALCIWVLFVYTKSIPNRGVQVLIKTMVLLIVFISSLLLMLNYGNLLGRYSLDRIENTATVTRWWIEYASGDEGSSYNLGEFSPTIGGMIQKFPAAIIVTFFRPFPWEAEKIIVLLSALEALIFIWITLKTFAIVGFHNVIRTINSDATIQFCIIFALIFGFAVGVSSYNFGALSRYKIPCLPFYVLSIMVIYYKHRPPSRKLFFFV